MQWLIFFAVLLLYGGQFFCLTLVWCLKNRVPPLNQRNSGVGIFQHHHLPPEFRFKYIEPEDRVNWKEDGF